MEDLRDERLAELITGFQAQLRWFNQLVGHISLVDQERDCSWKQIAEKNSSTPWL
jgi:hypothetical protein